MAESAVSFLLDRLFVLFQQQQDLLGGLEKRVEYIRVELGNMRAFLTVADAKQETDAQLKEWVNQREGGNRFDGYIKKICASVKILKARPQIASEIQGIKSRVENVSRNQQRFKDVYAVVDQGSSSIHVSYEWDDCSRGDALVLEEDVVGIEKPKKQLLNWVLSSNDGFKVISVIGMGGLGKTTLVKKVYDDTSVKANFDFHVWVTVSESFKTEHLLRVIIQRLLLEGKQQPPQELEAMNIVDMKEFVYKFLQHKTYVIVLDDVWKENAWKSIRYAFPRTAPMVAHHHHTLE